MAAEDLQEIVQAVENAGTRSGARLLDLCAEFPVLLVFLRHAGCIFCREAIADLSRERNHIERAGSRIVLVHMGDSEGIARLLQLHSLTDVECIRDDEQRLYRAFGLQRGTVRQLFGLKVFWRAFGEGVMARHGIGWQQADSFQMPGVFLLNPAGIIRRFRHQSTADRPNYRAVAAPVINAAE